MELVYQSMPTMNKNIAILMAAPTGEGVGQLTVKQVGHVE
jgi:hypothetical protein